RPHANAPRRRPRCERPAARRTASAARRTAPAVGRGSVLSVRSRFSLSLPDVSPELPQDEEWCWLEIGGRRVRLRLHDYAQIFRIPGLYEELFCRTLQCRSPQVVATALQQALAEAGVALAELPILDIGAG